MLLGKYRTFSTIAFGKYEFWMWCCWPDTTQSIITARNKPANYKETGRLTTSQPTPNWICLTVIMWYRSGIICLCHDDVIQWKHFLRYWPFVWGIHRSRVNSPHKGQCCGALTFFFDLCPNKRLSKQWWGWWFETPSSPLWRHCNVTL